MRNTIVYYGNALLKTCLLLIQMLSTPISLFHKKKKDGSVRVILNLKDFNDNVKKIHFKMETFKSVVSNILRYDYFVTIDLKAACFSVNVHKDIWKYLRLIWDGNIYQLCSLPQGSSVSTRVFIKLLKEKGLSNFSYIDDCLLQGKTALDSSNNGF